MKIKLFKVMLSLLVVGCQSQHKITYEKQMKEAYIYAFKMDYFNSLLLEAFNRSDEIKKILALDASHYGEPILSDQDMKLIDSLVKIDNSILVQDSVNRIDRVSEGAQGKPVFSYAIDKFHSKWLNSLAKERYKIFMKNKVKEE